MCLAAADLWPPRKKTLGELLAALAQPSQRRVSQEMEDSQYWKKYWALKQQLQGDVEDELLSRIE